MTHFATRLQSLSDDQVKIDASVENVVRKVERQFREMDKDQEELLINDGERTKQRHISVCMGRHETSVLPNSAGGAVPAKL